MGTMGRRKILVLGGSRGIGAAIVRRLSASGDEVVFTYASSEDAAKQLAEQTGSRALKLDSADRAAVAEGVQAEGPLDVLVINAGVLVVGNALELDPQAVERLFAINIHSPYFAAVAVARDMKEGGRIIVIGSNVGDRVPFPGITAYALSKSAMQGLVRGLARELGHRRITVNAVQPGPTETDMIPTDPGVRKQIEGFLAIQRIGQVEEVAALVNYLAGPEAGFVTGAMHTIDGGFAA